MFHNTFITPTETYFAAANGYTGFRSYFNRIFSPQEFTRIYVLKGGPGTGKSSLMKKVCAAAQSKNFTTEAIFCSSDPQSLDGIIINTKTKRYAVIDGTAPHETDTKLPGAADEIINLGENWLNEKLIEQRETIVKLNAEKSHYYKSAYTYLSLAGEFSERISKTALDSYEHSDAEQIQQLLTGLKSTNETYSPMVKLLSSFSKNGYKKLDIKHFPGNRKCSVIGKFGSEFIFMNHLLRVAKLYSIKFVRYPSPFSDEITEALYFTDDGFFISAGTDFERIIDTSAFLNSKRIDSSSHFLSYAGAQKRDLLNKAQEEFSLASERHFSLERIYTPAMNFEKSDVFADKIIADICS